MSLCQLTLNKRLVTVYKEHTITNIFRRKSSLLGNPSHFEWGYARPNFTPWRHPSPSTWLLMFNVAEVVNHVFSFLDYLEVYRLRSVCRCWRSLAEQHIYLRIKHDSDNATITVDLCRRNTLELKAASFDSEHGIIEFRPTLDVHCPNTLSNFERMISIYFDLWPDQHNPARLQCYSLPSWSTTHFMVERETHLAGHKGLLLSFAYVHIEQERRQKLAMQSGIAGSGGSGASGADSPLNDIDPLPVNTYPASVAATSPVPPKPHIHVAWLRVSLPWLMAGFHPKIHVPPIYSDRFHQLDRILADNYHIYHYNHYLEPVLRHIAEGSRDPPQSLVQSISSDDDYQWRLELAIELAGGDPRTRWLDARLWELLNGIDAPSNIDALVDRVKWQLSMAV